MRSGLKFRNFALLPRECGAQIGILLGEIRGTDFELEEVGGVEGRGREATVEVIEFAAKVIGSHRRGKAVSVLCWLKLHNAVFCCPLLGRGS